MEAIKKHFGKKLISKLIMEEISEDFSNYSKFKDATDYSHLYKLHIRVVERHLISSTEYVQENNLVFHIQETDEYFGISYLWVYSLGLDPDCCYEEAWLLEPYESVETKYRVPGPVQLELFPDL